jgi:hypothetical protein
MNFCRNIVQLLAAEGAAVLPHFRKKNAGMPVRVIRVPYPVLNYNHYHSKCQICFEGRAKIRHVIHYGLLPVLVGSATMEQAIMKTVHVM